MPKLLLSGFLLISLAACSAEPVVAETVAAEAVVSNPAVACNVTQDALIGDWQRSGEDGAFEQFSLSIDGASRRFDSWLHERPEVSAGSWTFQPADCRLAVSGPDSNLQWQFRAATGDAGAQLTLTPLDAGSGTADARYRRLID